MGELDTAASLLCHVPCTMYHVPGTLVDESSGLVYYVLTSTDRARRPSEVLPQFPSRIDDAGQRHATGMNCYRSDANQVGWVPTG